MNSLPIAALAGLANGDLVLVQRAFLSDLFSALEFAAYESGYEGTSKRLYGLSATIEELLAS